MLILTTQPCSVLPTSKKPLVFSKRGLHGTWHSAPHHLHAALLEGSAAAQLCESETRARKSHKAAPHRDDFPSHDRGVGAYIPVPWLTQNSFLGGFQGAVHLLTMLVLHFPSALCHPTRLLLLVMSLHSSAAPLSLKSSILPFVGTHFSSSTPKVNIQ